MQRETLKKKFHSNTTAVFPVIHVLDHEQTCRNIEIAIAYNVAGVFLINHDFDVPQFLPIVESVRVEFPDIWLGLNFLAVTGKVAFPILAKLEKEGSRIDGYWADDARIDESRDVDDQSEASEILRVKKECGWAGLYFGGTAFKKQRSVDENDYLYSAQIAYKWMDVVTTSGVATGQEAGTEKVKIFRQGVEENALALASGITPENVQSYAQDLDAILVATGINYTDDFYNIDPERLGRLMLNLD
jgi:predicted TIM-barrel enzyme